MRDPEPVCREMAERIDRFFASNYTREQKLTFANEAFKKLAEFNRRIAQARGIGKETQPSPRMPTDVLKAVTDENHELVYLWFETEWYLPVNLPASE